MRVNVITAEDAVAQGISSKQLLACLYRNMERYKFLKTILEDQILSCPVANQQEAIDQVLWDMERHSWQIHMLKATINAMPDNSKGAAERAKQKGVRISYDPFHNAKVA